MTNKKWLFWILLGLATVIVALAPMPGASTAPAVKAFQVEASQYAYSPAELRVNPGDRVRIDLTSTDVVHGLYIDGYQVSVEADPGQTAHLEFIADREGSFRIRCNVTCGAMHPFMIGKIQVGRNTLLWRAIGLAGIALLGAFMLFYFQISSRSVKGVI